MSDVIFEPIAKESSVDTAPPGLGETEAASSSDPPPVHDPPTQEAVVEPPAAPEPKKRGRPKGSPNKPTAAPKEPDPVPLAEAPPPKVKTKAIPKTKAPKVKQPPPEEDSSSDEEERQIYHKLKSDDLETSILQFLNNRRIEQQTKRRDLWANLARSGLR